MEKRYNYSDILLNDNFELNVWLMLFFENPKSAFIENWFFDTIYVKFKKSKCNRNKILKHNLRVRKWSFKSSFTTLNELEVVRDSLLSFSDDDLKNLKMLINYREDQLLEGEFKRALSGLLNIIGRMLVIVLPLLFGYQVIKDSIEKYIASETIIDVFIVSIYVITIYAYYLLIRVIIFHEPKKREAKKYLLLLISDILEERNI